MLCPVKEANIPEAGFQGFGLVWGQWKDREARGAHIQLPQLHKHFTYTCMPTCGDQKWHVKQTRGRTEGYCFSLTILLQQSDHCLWPSLLLLSSLNIIPTDCCQETIVQLPHVVICTAGRRPHLFQMCVYCYLTHTCQQLRYIPIPMHLEVAGIRHMEVMNHLQNVCTKCTSISRCPGLVTMVSLGG